MAECNVEKVQEEKLIERSYQTTEDLLETNGSSKSKEMEPTEQG